MAYADLLRDPRWQRKRLEVMADAGFACELCKATDKTLNVHHVQYVRGRMPWEYTRAELECLCEPCHKDEHGIGEKARAERARVAHAEKARIRAEQIRTEHPDLYAMITELAEIDAQMPNATRDEKDALMRRKIVIRDAMREHPGHRNVWRQF